MKVTSTNLSANSGPYKPASVLGALHDFISRIEVGEWEYMESCYNPTGGQVAIPGIRIAISQITKETGMKVATKKHPRGGLIVSRLQ